MLLLGCGLTIGALLHSLEWYGGGSPPARYLVPMLPAVALAGGMLFREPRRWRRAAELLLLPSLAVCVGPGDQAPPVHQPRGRRLVGDGCPRQVLSRRHGVAGAVLPGAADGDLGGPARGAGCGRAGVGRDPVATAARAADGRRGHGAVAPGCGGSRRRHRAAQRPRRRGRGAPGPPPRRRAPPGRGDLLALHPPPRLDAARRPVRIRAAQSAGLRRRVDRGLAPRRRATRRRARARLGWSRSDHPSRRGRAGGRTVAGAQSTWSGSPHAQDHRAGQTQRGGDLDRVVVESAP